MQSTPSSAAPSRKKTLLSVLILLALTGVLVLVFKDNWDEISAAPVSYTHLTLPTIRLV